NVALRANEPSASPTVGQYDASGDAKYPVIGGTNVGSYDFVNNTSTGLANQLSLSGSTLTVSMKLADLSATGLATSAAAVTGAQFLQYVTRWAMCGPYT